MQILSKKKTIFEQNLFYSRHIFSSAGIMQGNYRAKRLTNEIFLVI